KDDYTQQNSTQEDRLPSPDFGVEISHKTNLGIVVGLFDHLDLKANLFYARRTNILTGSGGEYSEILGVTPPLRSNGIVENRGLEIGLNWKDAIGNVVYHIGGQFSYAHNKIVNENESFRPVPYLK